MNRTYEGLSDLTNLAVVPEGIDYVTVIDCVNLRSLAGLPPSVICVEIRRCPALQSLVGLRAGVTTLICVDCAGLRNVQGLPNTVVSVLFSRCNRITNLEGLPDMLRGVIVRECVNLSSADGLPNEVTTASFARCTGLVRLGAIPATVNKLTLTGCTGLTSLDGIPAHEDEDFVFKLDCTDCTSLRDISALQINNLEVNFAGCAELRLRERLLDAIKRTSDKMDVLIGERDQWNAHGRPEPRPQLTSDKLHDIVGEYQVRVAEDIAREIPFRIPIFESSENDADFESFHAMTWYWRYTVRIAKELTDIEFDLIARWIWNVCILQQVEEEDNAHRCIDIVPDGLIVAFLKWKPVVPEDHPDWRDTRNFLREEIRIHRPHLLDGVNYARSGMQQSLLSRGLAITDPQTQQVHRHMKVHPDVVKTSISQMISSFISKPPQAEQEKAGRIALSQKLQSLAVRAKEQLDLPELIRALTLLTAEATQLHNVVNSSAAAAVKRPRHLQ